jgi:hypothetical protein
MFQDPDDGIIHQVLIHFVCAVAMVENLGMQMYMDGGGSNLMMLEDIF